MSSSQKGSITIIASVIIVLVLGTLLFAQRDRFAALSGEQNIAQVSSTSSKTTTVGVSIPVKEVEKDFSFTINVKNTSTKKQTLKNYSVMYQVIDIDGTVTFTSAPVETRASLTLEPGQVHAITPTFDFKKTPLSVGSYTLRAEVDGVGAGQNKFSVIDTSSPKSVKLPPVVKTIGEPIKLPPITPTPPTTPTTPPTTSVTTDTSKVSFSITANKSSFAFKEAIRGSVTLKNAGDKDVKLSFASGCYTTTLLNNAAEQTACTMALASITVPARGTKVIGFIFQKGASTNGLKTIKVQVIGHTGIATLQVGVGTSKASTLTSATVPLDGQAPVVTPPVVTPPTPPVPPVVTPTPPIVLPPQPQPVPGVTYHSAGTRAEYSALANTLKNTYGKNAATQADKILFTALENALVRAVNEIPAANWNSADKNKIPATLFLDIKKQNGSQSFTEKKSWLASAWNAFKNLFAANESFPKYGVFGIGFQNNKCGRYALVQDTNETYVVKEVEDEIFNRLRAESDFETAKDISYFYSGICGPLSVYHGLKKFDVAAAKNEADYLAHKAQNPLSNSSYYVGIEGSQYANADVMNTAIKKAQIRKYENQNTYGTETEDIFNLLTAFNDYGPADFKSCTTQDLLNTVVFPSLKKNNDCNTVTTLRIAGKVSSHSEHITDIQVNERAGTYVITTDDAFNQGIPFVSAKDPSKKERVKIPAKPLENKYAFQYDVSQPVGQRTYVTSMYTPELSAEYQTKLFGNPKTLDILEIRSCTDQSNIIRTLPNGKWAKYTYAFYNEMADYTASVYPGFVENYYEWENTPSNLRKTPKFSVCKKPNINEGIKIYESKMENWIIRWNQLAYKNKGYVPQDKSGALLAEKKEIENDLLFNYINKYKLCVDDVKSQGYTILPKDEKVYSAWFDSFEKRAKTDYHEPAEREKKNLKCGLLI